MGSRLDLWLTRVFGRQFPFSTLNLEMEESKEGEEEKEQEDEEEGAEVLDRLEGSTGYFQLREVGGGREKISEFIKHLVQDRNKMVHSRLLE